jgi:hypothetical protein
MVCRDRCGRTWLACTEPWPQSHHNTFGMNRNANCEPGLIGQHPCLISLILLWLNGSKSPQQCLTSSGKPSQKRGGCYSSKGRTNSILMPMILEWYFRAGVHIHLMTMTMWTLYIKMSSMGTIK